MTKCWIGALLIGLAASELLAQGGYYKNERWGYKIRVPRDFKNAALSATEEWIASKHIETRLLHAKKSEFFEADYPQMWVIGFPASRAGERGAKIEVDGDTTKISFKNPYKNYKDFVKRERWFVGGGYHFSKEEEAEIGGVKVTKYEIKVEKMVSAPYRIVTWVYHFDDIDFAVQCKVLEGYYKKYKSPFMASLKSLRRIERKGADPGAVTTGKKIGVDDVDEDKLTPAQLKKRRQEIFERTLETEIKGLPKDWFVVRSKSHVVLSNGSRKYARSVLAHADAIRGYLEKTFGDLGDDYVPPGLIRLFNTDAELEAYHGTTGWGTWARTVTASEESAMGRKTWALEPISDGVTGQFMDFRNRALYENMPFWFRVGLEQHMRFARTKGKSVSIKPDEYDRERIKEIIKAEKALPIKTLFVSGDDEQAYGYQCGSVVSYLLTKGNRGKFKHCIRNYLANMIKEVGKAQAEFDAFKKKQREDATRAAMEAGEAGAESEVESGEDEDDSAKAWEEFLEALKKKEKAIREATFQMTFGHISDKDWEKLDRRWAKDVG